MKRTTIIKRRERRKAKGSSYSDKIRKQKKGIFSNNSPFIPDEYGKNRFEVLEKYKVK